MSQGLICEDEPGDIPQHKRKMSSVILSWSKSAISPAINFPWVYLLRTTALDNTAPRITKTLKPLYTIKVENHGDILVLLTSEGKMQEMGKHIPAASAVM